MGNYKLPTLEKIVSNYEIVLMDSSAFSHCLRDKQDLISVEQRKILLKQEHLSRVILTNYLEAGLDFYITPLVLEESQVGPHYPYKKLIKELVSQKNRKVLDLRRQKRDSQIELRELGRLFQKKNRIYILPSKEQRLYNVYNSSYSGFLSLYNLSDADLDFLLHGAATSKLQRTCALICNDIRGIYPAWKHIRRQENLSSEQFGFYFREEPDGFRNLRYFSKITKPV